MDGGAGVALNGTVIYAYWTLNTTGFTYGISATANRVALGTLLASSPRQVYAGAFLTYDQTADDPNPCCNISDNGYAVSRSPYRGVLANNPWSVTPLGLGYYSGFPGTPDLQRGAITLAPVDLSGTWTGEGAMRRGRLYNVAYFYQSGYGFGDRLLVAAVAKYRIFQPAATAAMAVEQV
ncbi:MAG: hypothetical protein HY814_13910 [Candidatus Riflebacteria bacterium]|nr:hypothetical protein [Candidatus Riflebacteria bacterium]